MTTVEAIIADADSLEETLSLIAEARRLDSRVNALRASLPVLFACEEVR